MFEEVAVFVSFVCVWLKGDIGDRVKTLALFAEVSVLTSSGSSRLEQVADLVVGLALWRRRQHNHKLRR